MQFALSRHGLSVQAGELEALQQLALVVEQQGFERQPGFLVQVQFEGIAMLVAWGQRHDVDLTACHAGDTQSLDVVPRHQFQRIKQSTGCIGGIAHTRHQCSTHALRLAIDPQHFLGQPIELQQPLGDLAILYSVPDAVGRKDTVAFVNKGTLEVLLALSLSQTVEHVGNPGIRGIRGMRRNCQPSTEQKRNERYGAHGPP
ncbi:hypothetical protein D3C80_1303110 [compost metagenome]